MPLLHLSFLLFFLFLNTFYTVLRLFLVGFYFWFLLVFRGPLSPNLIHLPISVCNTHARSVCLLVHFKYIHSFILNLCISRFSPRPPNTHTPRKPYELYAPVPMLTFRMPLPTTYRHAAITHSLNSITLIEAKPAGILALLDEQCLVPRGTDKSFASNLYNRLTSMPRFSVPHADKVIWKQVNVYVAP